MTEDLELAIRMLAKECGVRGDPIAHFASFRAAARKAAPHGGRRLLDESAFSSFVAGCFGALSNRTDINATVAIAMSVARTSIEMRGRPFVERATYFIDYRAKQFAINRLYAEHRDRPSSCSVCDGEFPDLRPYGAGGSWICASCALKTMTAEEINCRINDDMKPSS